MAAPISPMLKYLIVYNLLIFPPILIKFVSKFIVCKVFYFKAQSLFKVAFLFKPLYILFDFTVHVAGVCGRVKAVKSFFILYLNGFYFYFPYNHRTDSNVFECRVLLRPVLVYVCCPANYNADFRSFMCSFLQRAIFIDFI